jgi:hypothetical protein
VFSQITRKTTSPHARRRRACPGDLEIEALCENNRGGRDKPGHDIRIDV